MTDQKVEAAVPVASDAEVKTPETASKGNVVKSDDRQSENRRKVSFATPLQGKTFIKCHIFIGIVQELCGSDLVFLFFVVVGSSMKMLI